MDNFDLKKYLIENKVTTNSKMLNEAADPSLQVVDFEEQDRYGEKLMVRTADGKDELYMFTSAEDDLDYHASSDGGVAYMTYVNADKSKELIMKADAWGSPDSPEYGELEFESLEYSSK
jgi:hypothetical protein